MIGTVEPVCPYCGTSLDKFPSRKKKCPSCGNQILPRTRWHDKARVLLTEDEAKTLLKLKRITSTRRTSGFTCPSEYARAERKLSRKLGGKTTPADVYWAILNEQSLHLAREMKFGLYRNTLMYMGDVLRAELRFKEALSIYCRVCYIDLCGRFFDDGKKQYWDLEFADLAPGIVSWIYALQAVTAISIDDLQIVFMQEADRLKKSLKTKTMPSKAWRQLLGELSLLTSDNLSDSSSSVPPA